MPPAIDSSTDSKQHQHTALQSLADHYALPVHQVAALYEAELTQLSEHASIKQYLVMLAIKHVDEQLRTDKQRH
ncbi:MAG: DUF3562 domain-containing protein [Burkholderiales bacterium]|nr:DUF3562 domain-containing protein [Burkholderiales bacterium]